MTAAVGYAPTSTPLSIVGPSHRLRSLVRRFVWSPFHDLAGQSSQPIDAMSAV